MIGSNPPFSEYLGCGLIKVWCVAHGYELHGWIAVTTEGKATIKIGDLAGKRPAEIDETVDIDLLLDAMRDGWAHTYDGPETRIGRIAVAKGTESFEATFDRGNINPQADVVQEFLNRVSKHLPFRIPTGKQGDSAGKS